MTGRVSPWRMLEPGRYELIGTDITIVNMKGRDLRYREQAADPWFVRRGRSKVCQVATLHEAKRVGERLAVHA